MIAPVGIAPVRTNTEAYDREQERHVRARDQWGIVCTPSPELINRAQRFGEDMWRVHKGAQSQDAFGVDYIRSNAEGQIGAELLANYYDTSADWTVYEDGTDPGWDMEILRHGRLLRVDAKTRRGWLILEDDHRLRRLVADLYGLVEHHPGTLTYTLCGVIQPIDFLGRMFRVNFGKPSYAVTAATLTGVQYFHGLTR